MAQRDHTAHKLVTEKRVDLTTSVKEMSPNFEILYYWADHCETLKTYVNLNFRNIFIMTIFPIFSLGLFSEVKHLFLMASLSNF